MRLGRARHFKAQVKQVLLTGVVTGGDGASAGTVLTAAAIGAPISAQVGSSVATSEALAYSDIDAIFTIAGVATVSGAGIGIDAEVAASAGVAAAAAVSATTSGQVGGASGVATGAWISQTIATSGGVASASGLATVLGIAAATERVLDGGGGARARPYGWWRSPKHNPAIRAKKPLADDERKAIEEVARDPFDKTIAELLAPYQTPQGIDWGEAESEQATNALRQSLQQHMQELQDEADDEEAILEIAF